MSNQMQQYNQPPTPRVPSMMQMTVAVFAALYWLSPLDLIPLIPIDNEYPHLGELPRKPSYVNRK